MAKQIMQRSASDNRYLHKDFHGALNAGIEYLHRHYGDQAVRDYLRDFTRSFYAPLIKEIQQRGLVALFEHFDKIYSIEGGQVTFKLTDDELMLDVKASPAVMHLRSRGYQVSGQFYETIRTVNDALCEETPFAAELLEYTEETGQSRQRFYRKTTKG